MNKTVLVTGAAGFIASHLIELLLKNNYNVMGIDNLRTGHMRNLENAIEQSKFEFIEQDICGKDCIDLQNIINTELDAVFHLAAISSVKLSTEDPVLVNRVNVSGTVNVLNLARLNNAKRVIFTSSAAVYGNPEKIPTPEDAPLNPLSPYAASKIAGEKYMTAFSNSYNIDSTVLRLFNIYGPRQAYSEYSGVVSIFINRALEGKQLVIEGKGNQTRSFLYVEDVARALLSAAEKSDAAGKIINISGESPISILELAEQIRSFSQPDIAIIHIPPRIGDVLDSLGTSKMAKTILDFTPKVSIEDGLRMTYEWCKNNT